MISSFGAAQLISCLKCLGFTQKPQVGSRHLKYSSPRPVQKGQRPFIIVLQGKSAYDPITCKNIIREIKLLGFTGEEITACMR
jgi:hypothetical protein